MYHSDFYGNSRMRMTNLRWYAIDLDKHFSVCVDSKHHL